MERIKGLEQFLCLGRCVFFSWAGRRRV